MYALMAKGLNSHKYNLKSMYITLNNKVETANTNPTQSVVSQSTHFST